MLWMHENQEYNKKMKSIIQNKIDEIEKGCGKLFEKQKETIDGWIYGACGDIGLCPSCKSEIKLLKDLQKELIDGFKKLKSKITCVGATGKLSKEFMCEQYEKEIKQKLLALDDDVGGNNGN